jgi:radical SAM enzyme (TIGR01210 family)
VIDLGTADRKARDAFVLGLRTPRNAADPLRPSGFFVEEEPRPGGGTERVATVLLTNRECQWRCLMCDLWKNTLEGPTPAGAVPEQIRFALERLPPTDVLKLYNAGSFFDRAAIPTGDHAEIATLVRGFDRVVVECHPALVGDSSLRFRDLLAGPELEVAMGLETANEEALRRLNKGMTVADFQAAAPFLLRNRISLRVFVLVGVPFIPHAEQAQWLRRSVEISFEWGCGIVSLIPTRLGNGALEELQRSGQFEPPSLLTFEESFALALASRPPDRLVLADLWDAGALAAPPCCAAARVERLRKMNFIQRNLPLPPCPSGVRHS